ncbi:glycosyltransferase family 4 protein [Gelidibacter salicanalis]|uniref:Glycosyltransferase family 4 protein n=1 Tax=Gelidibacter salicanalis TaxID=291193 RepID=A0A5C7AD90_9FLAO|nr:glycosyltransferase family 4 protein [Gelidibacter salicanalis]TXE05844.1 glycosyltransferase family 4 protein [Gelidibacter salicanalis]
MKILLVSIKSIHFKRWTEQLEHSGHEVFYFDISGKVGTYNNMPWLSQKKSWKYRWDFPGRYYLKEYFPKTYNLIKPLNERHVDKVFEAYLKEINPDVVQSFVLYLSCTPILSIMCKYKNIAWIYSAWGNDLFYYKNIDSYKRDIMRVLPEIDYMFADCQRDIGIAKELGFQGEVLGVFPGGGGYNLSAYNPYVKSLPERNIILVKGYEQRFGKAIKVIEALIEIKEILTPYKVVVFGADDEFFDAYKLFKDNEFIEVKGVLKHSEVLKLMGESLIYIGNSFSDGMPNTLLEAIIMGAFPIQSNPGGATAEIINHGQNGLLIEDCEDVEMIKAFLIKALSDVELRENAFITNQNELKPQLEIGLITNQVLKAYNSIQYI